MSPSENKIKINNTRCKKIAQVVKTLKLRSGHYERKYLTLDVDPETKMRAHFFVAAICHQTHILKSKKLNLVGWNYLEQVFTELMKQNSELLDPNYLVKLSPNDLGNQLAVLFSDDGTLENSTLDRLEERAGFMIEISRVLVEKYQGRLENMVNQSKGYLFKEGSGLYELLEQFEPFKDPFRKKSTIFIMTISGANLVEIKDPENFISPMDYHVMRVLLRMGCVDVLDKELEQKLKGHTPIASDQEIRQACIEAMHLIATEAGITVLYLDDMFWPLGRSCCHKNILCQSGKCDKDPCTFFETVDIQLHDKCEFQDVCKGSAEEEFRKFWQPIVETHFY